MPIALPPLPYPADALEPYLSSSSFEYHYGKHHASYVASVNSLTDGTELETASLEELVMKSEGSLFRQAAQAWNHGLFWRSMKPNGGGPPTGAVADAVNSSFGSLDQFRERFIRAGLEQFGSGWVWLTLESTGLAVSSSGNADTPLRDGKITVLTCDVWEHAYYIDYRNQRAAYLSVFLDHLLDWTRVEEALEA